MYIINMSGAVAKVLEQAKLLTAEEQIELVNQLSSQNKMEMSPDIEEVWLTELERRETELDSGKVKGLTYAELKAKLSWT